MSRLAATKQPPWLENLERLRESLVAQAGRIRAGSRHSTVKGTSLEVVLRRTLREYLPGYFRVGTGQIVNRAGIWGPQLDVIVYDQTVFPQLTVNEDGSVVVCAEALYAAVECKRAWDGGAAEHFRRFCEVESERGGHYARAEDAAAYCVLVFDSMKANAGSALRDETRHVGVYTVAGNRAWTSPRGGVGFEKRDGNALAALLGDILQDCMEKGQKDVGNFSFAYEALRPYVAWRKPQSPP